MSGLSPCSAKISTKRASKYIVLDEQKEGERRPEGRVNQALNVLPRYNRLVKEAKYGPNERSHLSADKCQQIVGGMLSSVPKGSPEKAQLTQLQTVTEGPRSDTKRMAKQVLTTADTAFQKQQLALRLLGSNKGVPKELTQHIGEFVGLPANLLPNAVQKAAKKEYHAKQATTAVSTAITATAFGLGSIVFPPFLGGVGGAVWAGTHQMHVNSKEDNLQKYKKAIIGQDITRMTTSIIGAAAGGINMALPLHSPASTLLTPLAYVTIGNLAESGVNKGLEKLRKRVL